ncbi:prenyltransferase/squalene oxidase repeat-containing protein [Streptomyces sp. TRM49041]|uniref:prenyltransferase/squalene oxidase repeat-containing protein n=1 Tax=Streptomyces sp. TRM49041 TaxID=2603216 RepID=UPI0011EFB51D|nr:prenyltransferase/squalene oxidase repeat-containing protein [Streptomyces sp. TRM49041]
MTTVRRGATALTATAVLLVGGAGAFAPAAHAVRAAQSPTPSPSAPALPAGLYGTKDPTYDGVWRQSLAFMAQQVSGVEPAEEAVAWLLGQQCDNGAFPSYRADTAEPCPADLPLDVNATAVALQALKGVDSHEERTDKAREDALDWLKGAQNEDGGWGYNPGSPSDANSTSLVISSLAGVGEEPGSVTTAGGKSPYDALLTFALPCSAPVGGGAFAYQPEKDGTLRANDDATAAAVLAGLGKHMLVRGVTPNQKPTCEDTPKPTAERAARNGAAHLAAALAKTGHLNLPPMPGSAAPADQPDIGNTADAVLALSAAGHGEEAAGAVAWLRDNSAAWAKEGGPAAYAQLVLAGHTAGIDTRDFGGADLVEQLNATGPEPASTPESREKEKAEQQEAQEDSGFPVWLIVAVFLVAGMGIGFLLSGRGKKQRP